jgi:muramoyltetrapeptide carboxypeptidase
MADGIDTEIIRQHPKIFLGFSDVTVLHSHLSNTTGLISFHGPVVTSLSRLTKGSILSLQAILAGKPVAWKEMGKVEILRGAETIRGVTTGGNLSTLVSALGTRFDISWKDKIVFLEDTNEPPYKIDRMLTQLGLAGKLKEAAAVIIGDFACGLNLDRNRGIQHHEVIWTRVLDLTEPRTCVWGNFPIGHGHVNLTIPLGADIMLNACSSEMHYT